MIRYPARGPRLLIPGMCAVVAAATVGWYATESVRPRCSYAVITSGYTGLSERNRSEDKELKELADRAYQQAIAAGRCDPPRARWHEWLD